jgi:hypothetical protein
MASDPANVDIASLQRVLVALEGDLKLTKQIRENGLQRLDDLRAENKRLNLQLAKVKSHHELAIKLELLCQQVEAKENEKHELALEEMLVTVIKEEGDDPVIIEDDRCSCAPHEQYSSSRSLDPLNSNSLLNHVQVSPFISEEDDDDASFLFGESQAVCDDSTRWRDKGATDLMETTLPDEESTAHSDESSVEPLEAYFCQTDNENDLKALDSLDEKTETEDNSESMETYYFCQIDANGNSSFSVLLENIGLLVAHDGPSAAGSEDGGESKNRSSIRKMIQHTKKLIRGPRLLKNKIDVE